MWTNLVKILLKPYLKSSRIFELEVRYFVNLFVAPGWDMDHRKFKENLEIQKMWKQTHCRWNWTNMNKRFDWLPTRPVGGTFCILSNEMEDSFVFTWSNSNSIFGQVWKLDRTVTKDELNQGIILAGYGNFGSNFSSYLHFLRLTLLLFGDL